MNFRHYSRGRFTSKQDALRMRVHVWTCEACGVQHTETQPRSCVGCGAMAFFHFDSKAEASRFAQLRLLLNAGMIRGLRLQVRFPLYADGGKISSEKLGKPLTTYVADFCYEERRGSEFFAIVEDTKGDAVHGQTDLFKLKRKLVEACYGVRLRISTNA